MEQRVFTAPEGTGTVFLNRTLPDLLYDACERYTNEHAFNRTTSEGWASISLDQFRGQVEATASGFLDLGLQRGDRVALFMESDAHFCVVDMACMLAGLVDAPIYLTHGEETLAYVLAHSGARAVVVSDPDGAARIRRVAAQLPDLIYLISVVPAHASDEVASHASSLQFLGLEQVQARGRGINAADRRQVQDLKSRIRPSDLATIIYTSGTTGRPKGVMLSHENMTYNALTAFSGLSDYRPGAEGETVLSFLPLTHVFARTLQYGFMAHASSVYFSDPDRLSDDLKRVRPTIFASVPRVLEKVYTRIRERAALEKGIRKRLLKWSLSLAERYQIGEPPKGWYAVQLAVADRLVFKQWRAALGGRVKYVISGGAALNPELAGLFGAAGVTVLQGYGLTESSPIISYNRAERNRADTVGILLPGLEVRIAEDGEILTRGPHVMQGYYQDPERTAEVLDEEGWLRTGDVGEMVEGTFLRITDRKKDLFKLSTGKYVMPQPLESRLTTEPLIEQVVVVGTGYKYCTALIFPDQDVLRTFARTRQIDATLRIEELIRHPAVVARYERIVEKANRGMDHWSTIKRFLLVPEHLTVDAGLLTPTMKVRRSQVHERYAKQIQALYSDEDPEDTPDRTDASDTHAEAVVH